LQELGIENKAGQKKGALERFGVDLLLFNSRTLRVGSGICRRSKSTCVGGTTHPFMTLKLLTSGRYESPPACFTVNKGVQNTTLPPTTYKRPLSGSAAK